MSTPTILVVEDDDAVRQGVVDTMKFAGYQVLAAPDGRIGREAALTATYDLSCSIWCCLTSQVLISLSLAG